MNEVPLVPFRELVAFARGGGWGSDRAESDRERVRVIRGTDFSRLLAGDLSAVPRRWERRSKVPSRRLRNGDVILEIAGGSAGSGQSTGRSFFVSDRLLEKFGEETVIPASFCRVVRFHEHKVLPSYAYYGLQDMWKSGRAREYEHQSTGLSNFQFEYFLDSEFMRLPPLPEQRAIAEVLGSLDDKIEANTSILRIVKEISRAIWRKHSVRSRSVPLSNVVQVGLSGVWGQQARTPGATVEVLCLRGRDLEDLVDRVQPAPPRRWLSSKQIQSRLSTGPEIWTAGSGSLGPTLLVTEILRKASALPLLYSNFVKRLVPLSGMERHLPSAWFALLDSWQSGEFSSFSTGTAMPNLDATAMLAMVLVPVLDDVAAGEVAAWAELALDPRLLAENQKLAAIRDALLPKLLSGELRVRDAEELIGEAV